MTIDFSFLTRKQAKVGDIVKITDPKWVRNGQKFKVVELSKRGIYIKYEDTGESVFCPCNYEIIESE